MGLVAPEVHRLLGRGAVMAEAVGLDDEAEVGPEEVDPIAAEAALGLGRGKAGLADDREEAPLERVRGAAEGLRVEDPLQPTDARAARLLVERRAESVGADQVEAVGLVDGVFDLLRRQLGREVDEDRDGIGDRDAADEPRRSEVRPPVQADPGASTAATPLGTATSIGPPALRPMRQSSAALRWLSRASAPQASVAALKRPSRSTSGRPTA